MSGNFVLHIAAMVAGCAIALACAGGEAEHWQSVGGAALQALFKDKEFADGAHFAYQFKANGTFTGTEMAKDVSGSWRVRGDEFCWHWLHPRGPRECYAVEQEGEHVRLLINGAEAWYGTLR